MKLFLRLCLTIVVFGLSVSLSFAQEGIQSPIVQNETNLQQREVEINDLQSNRYDNYKVDPELVKLRNFVRNLTELNIKSKELLLETQTENPTNKNRKKIANLANKLSNVAKTLRENLDLKDRKEEKDNTEISFDGSDGHLRYLSSKVGELVRAINETQKTNFVDASKSEQTEQNLKDIEKISKKIKLLASKK